MCWKCPVRAARGVLEVSMKVAWGVLEVSRESGPGCPGSVTKVGKAGGAGRRVHGSTYQASGSLNQAHVWEALEIENFINVPISEIRFCRFQE